MVDRQGKKIINCFVYLYTMYTEPSDDNEQYLDFTYCVEVAQKGIECFFY